MSRNLTKNQQHIAKWLLLKGEVTIAINADFVTASWRHYAAQVHRNSGRFIQEGEQAINDLACLIDSEINRLGEIALFCQNNFSCEATQHDDDQSAPSRRELH